MTPLRRQASHPAEAFATVIATAQIRGFVFVSYSRLKLGRAIIVAGLLGLSLGACGRKGPLEPPPNAANSMDLPDGDVGGTPVGVPSTDEVSPLAKPSKANRAIKIPEKSFVLDPIL